jgi:hypothetical protein
MLWNPYRDVHVLARQGALGALLAMLLVVLVVILVGGPEKGWPGALSFPTLPLPVPASGPDSHLSQRPAPTHLPASEGRSEPTLASAASELATADHAVAPGQVSAPTSELSGGPVEPAPATSGADSPVPAAANPEPAAGPTAAPAALPPAPAVGGQASVKVSIPGPPPPPVTAPAPRLPQPPPPARLPQQPPALPAVPKLPPTPHV